MPLLILDAMTAAFKEYTFTFHYASTYTGLSWHTLRHPMPNLHSTMLLLIRLKAPLRGRCWKNLHSTMLLLIRKTGGIWTAELSIIYIPLCFYLYVETILDSLSRNEFTFHYASTYTFTLFWIFFVHWNLHSTMLLLIRWFPFWRDLTKRTFTFHYASTYTV